MNTGVFKKGHKLTVGVNNPMFGKPAWNRGLKTPREVVEKMIFSKTGVSVNVAESNGLWKGDKASYSAIHKFIRKYHGVASLCRNKLCPKKSDRYEWALRKGKKYSRDINDYVELCKHCHMQYDLGKSPNIKL